MSLKKKIILGFLASAVIIATLIISWYINFLEIRKEIRYLELSDTLRSKTLQIRRHEKNFLLYGDREESGQVHAYLREVEFILSQHINASNSEKLIRLSDMINDYRQRFERIETTSRGFLDDFNRIKPSLSRHSSFFPLIESTFLERPLINATLFQNVFLLSPDEPAVSSLKDLGVEIGELRKTGEEILTISKELDRSARIKVDNYISNSQRTAFFIFPLFIIVGLGFSFAISHGIVNRLRILADAIEKTGKGDFSSLPAPSKHDEVGLLIDNFNRMERDLIARDEQLRIKNEELLQSKKLASIGTLASGVAHELNNPLNNIYTSAQRLLKKTGDECPAAVRNGLNDIFSQTMRVKRIVADLLEFARGKELQLRDVDLGSLVAGIYSRLGNTMDTEDIQFDMDSEPEYIHIVADPGQLEQVLINLFTNAVEAMSGYGQLTVSMEMTGGKVTIRVADTGSGIPEEQAEKIFEPFFTTKDKGTGLGLAIVFSIIQKHNGEIHMESKAGAGTAFIITLPVYAGKE